jgi:hypothetical protein
LDRRGKTFETLQRKDAFVDDIPTLEVWHPPLVRIEYILPARIVGHRMQNGRHGELHSCVPRTFVLISRMCEMVSLSVNASPCSVSTCYPKERGGRHVPADMLYGSVVEYVDMSVEEMRRILIR